MAESLSLLDRAHEDGTTALFATTAPMHQGHALTRAAYMKVFHRLKRACPSGLSLYPAMEVDLSPSLPGDFANGQYVGMGETGYVSVRLPEMDFPAYTLDILYHLTLEGVRVLLIHPERNRGLQKNRQLVENLRAMEVMGVASAASLVGLRGNLARHTAWDLVGAGFIQTVASDGHLPEKRPLRLSRVRSLVEQRLGSLGAERFLYDVPLSVVNGLPVEMKPYRSRGWTLLGL